MIKHERYAKKNVTQTQLAEALSVSSQSVSKWENHLSFAKCKSSYIADERGYIFCLKKRISTDDLLIINLVMILNILEN